MNYLKKSIDQIISENNIPFKWSVKVTNELSSLTFSNESNRINLEDVPFVTIDGKDAKDFDDAVFCDENKSGYILYVAIADVADVVKEETEIDKEAFKRGTSIYFPKKVIPMLPEKISNDMCSLVPNQKRNVLVCKIYFDTEATINTFEFIEGKIKSSQRFTYEEVERFESIDSKISNSISSLRLLTKKLLLKRSKRHALEIESSEPYIAVNDEGELQKISFPKRLFAHQMIEESMIAANVCAAKFMKQNFGYGIYRVHEEPEFLKLENLKKFFQLKGYSGSSSSNALDLLNSFSKHASKNNENKLLNILILQSLKRAQYSTKEIGHFGLQLERYSHFTSPIRRYPDLLAHRLIKSVIKNSNKNYSQEIFEKNLNELSSLEKRAEVASRQVTQQMICYHLQKFLGEEFNTVVVGVAEFGLFCEIQDKYISGLIHVSDLKRDRYIFDSQANILKGKRTGKTYRIGQKIRAQLVNVIPEDRKITLLPA